MASTDTSHLVNQGTDVTDASALGLPSRRPKRADARRNYDALIAAAREAFTERDTAASLEDIARRAGVGIGTLYRNFPTRHDLVEAVYVEEVEALCASAVDSAEPDPWLALTAWLHRFVGYIGTKMALAEELMAGPDGPNAPVLHNCRGSFQDAGTPLLRHAQEAGIVRSDADISDVVRMVAGIAKATAAEPEETHRILDIALDGLRYRAT